MAFRLNTLGEKLGTYGFGLLAMLVPAAMQFVLFAVFARVLGAQQYGLYIVLMSWTPVCFELAGWGAGEYLLKRTAQDRTSFAAARGHLHGAFLLSVPFAATLFVVLTLGLLNNAVSPWTIAAIGLAEFTGLRLLVNAEHMALALSRLGWANWLRGLQAAPRLSAVLVACFLLEQRDFAALALAGSLGMLCAGLGAAWIMNSVLPAATGVTLSRSGLHQGFWFTGNQLVRAGQHNVDRLVLGPLVDPATLALFSAAQRFVQIGMLPLQAVLRIAYPGFFEAGKAGIGSALHHAISVLPWSLAAAAITAIALLGTAPLLPLLIGPDFTQSVNYLLYLAPILPLFALNTTMADTLSGAGFLSLRLLLTASGVAVQAGMFVLLHQGMQIVLASYAGIGLSCLLTLGAALVILGKERRSAKILPGSP